MGFCEQQQSIDKTSLPAAYCHTTLTQREKRGKGDFKHKLSCGFGVACITLAIQYPGFRIGKFSLRIEASDFYRG